MIGVTVDNITGGAQNAESEGKESRFAYNSYRSQCDTLVYPLKLCGVIVSRNPPKERYFIFYLQLRLLWPPVAWHRPSTRHSQCLWVLLPLDVKMNQHRGNGSQVGMVLTSAFNGPGRCMRRSGRHFRPCNQVRLLLVLKNYSLLVNELELPVCCRVAHSYWVM